MQISTRTDTSKYRKNVATDKKEHSLKNGFEVLKPLIQHLMQISFYYSVIKSQPCLELRGQWGPAKINGSSFLRMDDLTNRKHRTKIENNYSSWRHPI